MQGAQTWADHGDDLTRESLLLHYLDDVKSETSKDGDQEGAWAMLLILNTELLY